MSISQALNAAGSGLAAASRAIQVGTSNISNALTPGYAPQSLTLASNGSVGSGVKVTGIDRKIDPVLQNLMRVSAAAHAEAEVSANFWSRIGAATGMPGDPGALSSLLDDLAESIRSAADRPDLENRLEDMLRSASQIVEKFADVETVIQQQRANADGLIARDVDTLNHGLERLHRMNTELAKLTAAGQPTMSVLDARDRLLQELSEIVPLVPRSKPDGQLSLHTKGGLSLLDVKPVVIGFQANPHIAAEMTIEGGQLSGLTVNGQPVTPPPGGALAGGRLAATFVIRDQEAPGVQSQIDQMAAGLITRFQDPRTDPTLPSTEPGLFTDAGNRLGLPQVGLAGRLGLNPGVVPAAGGDLWKLRDGLGASAPGPVGQQEQLSRLLDAVNRPISQGPGMPTRSLQQDVAALHSRLGSAQHASATKLTATHAQHAELAQQDLAKGVDIDAEMQRLLLVETSYAANARIIRVADDMLRRLLEI